MNPTNFLKIFSFLACGFSFIIPGSAFDCPNASAGKASVAILIQSICNGRIGRG